MNESPVITRARNLLTLCDQLSAIDSKQENPFIPARDILRTLLSIYDFSTETGQELATVAIKPVVATVHEAVLEIQKATPLS